MTIKNVILLDNTDNIKLAIAASLGIEHMKSNVVDSPIQNGYTLKQIKDTEKAVQKLSSTLQLSDAND
jgi:hypothetical protein